MGALRATVSIRGREIDILFSHIEFSRKTDKKRQTCNIRYWR